MIFITEHKNQNKYEKNKKSKKKLKSCALRNNEIIAKSCFLTMSCQNMYQNNKAKSYLRDSKRRCLY